MHNDNIRDNVQYEYYVGELVERENKVNTEMGNLQSETETIREVAAEESLTTTWNGAKSYATVNNPLVELFFKSVRNIPCTDYRCIKVKKGKNEIEDSSVSDESKTLEHYFNLAWDSDPLRTLKFVFYLRDCRGGKGEKKLFRALVRHMRERGLSHHLEANLNLIPFYGSWKDVPICFFGTALEEQAITLIADQLRKDISTERPSLCAKYAPSEGGAIDKKHHAAYKIASKLGATPTRYRKHYLVPLRSKLNIVERDMCSNNWSEIEYEKVASIAGSRYKAAFNCHDEQRYKEYLAGVQRGEKKMNTSVLMPYQIVSPYLDSSPRDETIEAQWTAFLADRRAKWPGDVNVLPLIDVSGSMFSHIKPSPCDVSVSLGIVFSLLNSSEQYRGKFITFSSTPELLSISTTGDSLHEQVNYIKGTNWGGNTDFQKVFDLILNVATTFRIPQEQMPQILLVLSDMQFDSADSSSNWESIGRKYKEAGYRRPTIIFWNLNGRSSDYPIPSYDVPDCALLSGFNDNIMYSLLDGTIPSPLEIVHNALDNDRYGAVRLATE